MTHFTRQATRLIERARWKEEGWERPDPPEVLRDYAESGGDHFVHFSDVGPGQEVTTPADLEGGRTDPRPAGGFKVGVNPETGWNTPAALYTYPLDERTWNMYFAPGREVPFAESKPWVYVVELAVSGSGLVRLDASGRADGFGAARRDRAVERLTEAHPRRVAEACRELADRYGGEPTEAGGAIDVVDRSLAINADADAVREAPTETALYHWAKATAKIDTPFAHFWNFTRRLAGIGDAAEWNGLLREAGIAAVVDRGSGLVHDHEPHQAAFLEPSTWDAEDAVPNPYEWRRNASKRRKRADLRDALASVGLEHLFGEHVDPDAIGSPAELGDTLQSAPMVKQFLDSLEGFYKIVARDEVGGGMRYAIRGGTFEGEFLSTSPFGAGKFQLQRTDITGATVPDGFANREVDPDHPPIQGVDLYACEVLVDEEIAERAADAEGIDWPLDEVKAAIEEYVEGDFMGLDTSYEQDAIAERAILESCGIGRAFFDESCTLTWK